VSLQYILWLFGVFFSILVHMLYQAKPGNPACDMRETEQWWQLTSANWTAADYVLTNLSFRKEVKRKLMTMLCMNVL
jgi:predicted cobalt transporter CbtA